MDPVRILKTKSRNRDCKSSHNGRPELRKGKKRVFGGEGNFRGELSITMPE
jgi:hypothetical protein